MQSWNERRFIKLRTDVVTKRRENGWRLQSQLQLWGCFKANAFERGNGSKPDKMSNH